jgi:F0F1-type ATP synthase assembly protein I
MSRSGQDFSKRPPMALAGLGFELLAAIVGFAFVGYWIDRHYETEPWGLVIGAVLGIVGGLYNFIHAAIRATREDGRGSGGR